MTHISRGPSKINNHILCTPKCIILTAVPNMLMFNIFEYKRSACARSAVLISILKMTTAIMPSSSFTLTDKLRQAYNAVLLQISFNLDQQHQEQLHYYFKGLIPITITDTINILRSLEYNRKIWWEDLNLVKEAMHDIGRLDIVKEFTEFEIKRDLTLLLDFYARKILGLDLDCCSISVKKVAGHLARLMAIVRDKINIKTINLTVESSKDIRKVLVDFEEEIDEGLPGGVLVPLFPSKIALCSHVPTLSQNVFVL